jgi:hypothetical protein
VRERRSSPAVASAFAELATRRFQPATPSLRPGARLFRVAAVCALVAWVLLQVSATAFPYLGLPAWAVTLVIVLSLLFFPLALVLAWAFDLTPEGVKRATPAPGDTDADHPIAYRCLGGT